MTKHDSVTGQSDASLADAEFSVYEYQKETGSYEPYHYEDRKLMTDREDGTYEVGPLYYKPSNEGRFMILETRSPMVIPLTGRPTGFSFRLQENRRSC